MKVLISIMAVSILGACATAESLKVPLDAVAEKCISTGAPIDTVDTCLRKEGIEIKPSVLGENIRRFSNCRPATTPLMTACAWIHIVIDSEEKVSSWEVASGYDGP